MTKPDLLTVAEAAKYLSKWINQMHHGKKALLTMKETAEVLFGENDDKARRRAIYLLQSQNIDIIKTGQKRLVRRDVLNKHFGIDADGS